MTMARFGKYEPLPRYQHSSGLVGGKVLTYSGRIQDISEASKRRLAAVVEEFDPHTELWQQKNVTGQTPAPGMYLAASVAVKDDLFMFGGFIGGKKYNSLHKLSRTSDGYHCCELPAAQREGEGPMRKYGSGMVAFSDYLGVFGGYGEPQGLTQPGSFIKDYGNDGWTNEFHVYHLKEGVWSCPATTGEKPPPCIHFTFTAIDDRRAVLFGGYNGEQGRMNDVYIIDLHSMHWTKLSKSGAGPWPEERLYHAACCLNYGQQHPHLLITGGVDRLGKPLADVWILDIERGRWSKESAVLSKPRRYHSTTAFSLCTGQTEVTMFGGTAEPWTGSDEKQPKLADTTLLQFKSVQCDDGSQQWTLPSVAGADQLTSPERLREKQRLKEMEREERSRELPFRAERQSQEEKRRREELQQRVVEAERRAQEESRRADRAQQRAREMEGRVREESRHVAGAAQLTSPNTHIERKRLKVEPPTLPELIRMEVTQEVGNNYTNFGILLLDDRTGNRVYAIEDECRGKPERIMLRILQEWVLGKGATLTWQTLIKTLKDCKLNILADRIQATKLPPAP